MKIRILSTDETIELYIYAQTHAHTHTRTHTHTHTHEVPLGRIFFQLFTIEIKSAIANNLKTNGMMKMQCVTIYPNIYECVSDYM